MNELEKELAKVVEKAIDIAEQTGEFVIEQAPDLLREFYLWHTTKFILGIILGLVLMIIGFWIFKIIGSKKELTKYGEECPKIMGKYYDDDRKFSGLICLCILHISGITTLCFNIYWLIFISTAPKLYLIEYFIK